MNICCFSMWGDNYAEIAAITQPVLQAYCGKHGYSYSELILEGTGNDYAYKKHEYIKELFKQDIDVVFYIDCDAIVTNLTIPVTNYLEDDYSFFATKDANEINTGVILIRNDKNGNWYNDYVLSRKNDYGNEQNIANAVEFAFKDFMKIVPHPSFNSYDYSLYKEFSFIKDRNLGQWHEGDFVFHVPALSIENRIKQLKTKKIIYD